jgi:hypothetical protein
MMLAPVTSAATLLSKVGVVREGGRPPDKYMKKIGIVLPNWKPLLAPLTSNPDV